MRIDSNKITWTVVVMLAGAVAATSAAEVPQPVSPGGTGRAARIAHGCPTFSWTEVPGAERYELVVYAVDEGGAESAAVLRRPLPGGAKAWTPSLDACLEWGQTYAWSVRAIGKRGDSDWSAPSLFEVVAGPIVADLETALQIVRQYVGNTGSESTGDGSASVTGKTVGSRPLAADPRTAAGAAALANEVGDTALLVNDSPVLTASSAGSLVLCAHEIRGGWRYWDLGDGTVLDCNTGLIWLKDADCLGLREWDDAENAVAGLASGACGLTDGSSPGDWRQPTALEFCSAFAGAALTPCPQGAAPESLLDSSLTEVEPKVTNASGDGVWTPGDAFVDVQSWDYWSATDNGSNAWGVHLGDGYVNSYLKTGDANYVWPVRGGQ